jgi:hypothetical protein
MRGLRLTLCLLLAAAGIVGMLPIAQALASGPDLSGSGSGNLQQDGLISKLLHLGDDDDDDEDDEDDDENDDDNEGGGDDDEGEDDDDDDGDHDGNDDDDHSGRDRPEAYDQIVELDEDETIRIELEGRADDRDDPVTFAIVEGPEHGELVDFDDESGTVSYKPAAHYYGSDNFTFKAIDGDRESRPAIVTVRIDGVNDAPVALPAEITTSEGKSISIILKGTDVENEDLEFEVLS